MPDPVGRSLRGIQTGRGSGTWQPRGGPSSIASPPAGFLLLSPFFEARRAFCYTEVTVCGPVAQLGARFHGMEEVVSSNLTRSTKTFQTLTGHYPNPHL